MILKKISLEQVQELVEKLENLKKTKQEYNKKLDSLNIEMKDLVDLYHEKSQIIINKQRKIKEYQKELTQLNDEKNLFKGNFFEKYKRKEYLKQNIARLNEEIETTLNNRVEVKNNYDAMINPKVEITKNIMGLDEQISNIIEQLNDIYFECHRQSKMLNKKIETRKTSAHIAAANRDVYATELKELLEEIIVLTEEKNTSDYEKIVRFIDGFVCANQAKQENVNEVLVKDKELAFNNKLALIKQRLINKKIETENTIFAFMTKVEENSNLLLTNVSNSILSKINNSNKRTLTRKI